MFVAVVAITAALWSITYVVTRAYAARQSQLAREWFQRAEADMQARRLETAIAEFRTAIAYSHDNFAYRLRLAQVLLADHQWRQAVAYLRVLWDEEPGNGTVNLELARQAASADNFETAVRYYHGAIYGFWDRDPIRQRRDAHFELVTFLLAHHATQEAESEIIALSAELPRDPALLVRAAELFQAAGQRERALREYRDALALDPRNAAALAGAGAAAFQLQRYDEARRHLQKAVTVNPQDTHSAGLLETAELVGELDPYAPRLTAAQRSRRVLRDFEQARYRLEECARKLGIILTTAAAPTPLQSDYTQLLALKRRVTASTLPHQPDLVDAAMDLVFRIERDAAQPCGAPAGADYALLLIARQREGAER